MPNKEEKEWIKLKLKPFDLLPPNGQKAFFRYLLGKELPEGKDIFSMDPSDESMTPDAIKYQFWLKWKREEEHLKEKFSEYFQKFKKLEVTDRIEEVKTCIEKFTKTENTNPEREACIDDEKKAFMEGLQYTIIISEQTKNFMKQLCNDLEPLLQKRFAGGSGDKKDRNFIKYLEGRPDK